MARGMRIRAVVSVASAWLAVAAAPACKDAVFQCESDEQCEGLDGGRCEATGYCRVPEPNCASGREYGPHAGALSGECVPPTGETAETGDAGGTVDTGDSVDPTTASGPTSPGTSVASTVSDATTMSVDATGEDTSTGPRESSSSSSAESTTSEPTADPCEPSMVFVEETFDALPPDADHWEIWVDGDASAMIVGGAVVVGVDTTLTPIAYYNVGSAYPLTPPASIGVEVVEPPMATGAELLLAIDDGTREIYVTVLEDRIESFYYDGMTYDTLVSEAFDPEAHRWLRLVVDAMSATVEVQTSPDRSTWTTFDVVDASPMDLFEAYAIVAGGAYEGLHMDASLLAFDNAWMCLSGDP